MRPFDYAAPTAVEQAVAASAKRKAQVIRRRRCRLASISPPLAKIME